mmetsp:Transcript_2570/g.9892  ORF Transcript_2570/g.9892 Transcript_2570/m.9892 type:complete len:291 (-) Transcript_2570:49-921(-)
MSAAEVATMPAPKAANVAYSAPSAPRRAAQSNPITATRSSVRRALMAGRYARDASSDAPTKAAAGMPTTTKVAVMKPTASSSYPHGRSHCAASERSALNTPRPTPKTTASCVTCRGSARIASRHDTTSPPSPQPQSSASASSLTRSPGESPEEPPPPPVVSSSSWSSSPRRATTTTSLGGCCCLSTAKESSGRKRARAQAPHATAGTRSTAQSAAMAAVVESPIDPCARSKTTGLSASPRASPKIVPRKAIVAARSRSETGNHAAASEAGVLTRCGWPRAQHDCPTSVSA